MNKEEKIKLLKDKGLGEFVTEKTNGAQIDILLNAIDTTNYEEAIDRLEKSLQEKQQLISELEETKKENTEMLAELNERLSQSETKQVASNDKTFQHEGSTFKVLFGTTVKVEEEYLNLSVEEICNNPKVQAVLVEMQSGAIEKIS
jgi:hypothetical protein